VKRAKRGVLRSRVFTTFLFFFAVSFAVFYVWERITALELTISVEELKDEILSVENAAKRLEIEKTVLSSRSRIERIAVDRLGLRFPATDQIVVVRSDSRCIHLSEKGRINGKN